MIYLNKILPLFVLPLGITFVLLIVGVTRKRPVLIWAGVVLLWIASTPLVAGPLMRASEAWAVRIPVSDAPVSDAIVVLSGGRIVAPGPAKISEWEDPDRFFSGVELFQAGKAPLLIFTGAWLPWEPDAPLEGEVLARQARALGVPADHIAVTGRVSNTVDEARAVATLLRGRPSPVARVLLVTSAFHMPRARQLFEQEGLAVSPFPVDFQRSADVQLNVLSFLPSVGDLGQTQTALREMYGRLFYRLRPF